MDNFRAVRLYCDTLLDVDIDEIDGYRIRRALGAGSVGTAWLARDLTSGRFVVIKRVPVSVVPAPEVLRRDLALARGLDHPHVVRVIEVRQVSREWLVVSDYAPAGSLTDLLNRRGPLSTGELVTLLTPIAQALAAAEKTALTHDHLGTGDIVLTADGRPLLSDLGLRSTTEDTDHALDCAALYAVGQASGADPSVFPESLFTSDLHALPSRLLSISTPAPIALAFARGATTTGAGRVVQAESGGRLPRALDASAGFFLPPANGRPSRSTERRSGSIEGRKGRLGRAHLEEMAQRLTGPAMSKVVPQTRVLGLVTALVIAVGTAGGLTITAVRDKSIATDPRGSATTPSASLGSIAPQRPTANSADPRGGTSANPTADSRAERADPSANPSADASAGPSGDPFVEPSTDPTADPTSGQTADPTVHPTTAPTVGPTARPAGARTAREWAGVLGGLDRVRAEAFARVDVGLLDSVYRRGTAPWRTDREVLAAYRQQATRVEGLRIAVQQIAVVRTGRGVVVLRVVDRFAGGTAIDAYGRRTELPSGPVTARRITLTGSGNDWRISAIVRA